MNLVERAAIHAALGDPVRLAMVEDLMVSDRSPGEIAERFGLATNLAAHHLSVLERAGLVERSVSAGDARRRYVHLRPGALPQAMIGPAAVVGSVLFVCTHNSARSQLAAALWAGRIGTPATSAGTHPSSRVHPGAVDAARKVGLDLSGARPRHLDEVDEVPELVVTVCDRAHEELRGHTTWHWSIPDPVEIGTPDAFEAALAHISKRIDAIDRGRDR